MKVYSVKLLKTLVYSKDELETRSYSFEESIVLTFLENDFFNKSEAYLLQFFKDKLNSEEYLNANGDLVYNSVVKLLGYFEIVDMDIVRNLELNKDRPIIGEVYSRHLFFDNMMDIDELMEKYYSDYKAYPI